MKNLMNQAADAVVLQYSSKEEHKIASLFACHKTFIAK